MKTKLSKAGLLGAVLGAGFLVGLDFVVVRPNRLAPGEGWSLFTALNPTHVAALLGGWCFLLAAAVRPTRSLIRIGSIVVPILALAMLWEAGNLARSVAESDNPFIRTSLGSGFWASLFGLYIVAVEFFRKAELPAWGRIGLIILIPAGLILLSWSGSLRELSLMIELVNRSERFVVEFKDHVLITLVSVGFSSGVGLPLGLLIFKNTMFRRPVLYLVNILQTIPSLALFGLLIAPLAFLSREFPFLRELGIQGIGMAPAIIALTLYALLPIVRNTFTGFSTVDRSVIEAGEGMGMNRLQLFRRVELPVAMPIILNGVRIACIQNIGNTAVAALIGAGGFGVFIFQGLGQSAIDLVLLGALPTIILAVVADYLLQFVIYLLTPRGLA